MRAAVYTGNGHVAVQSVPVPAIGPGELLVRVEACGICPTDARKYTIGVSGGEYPLNPGHEWVGLVEETGRRHGVQYPFQGTIATTNGERLWAFRYSSEGRSRSLYFSTAYETLKALYPDDPRLEDFDEESRIIVSEPLGDVAGVWNPVPEATWGVVQPGPDEIGSFRPVAPVTF